MTKKLNTDSITNELQESAFFSKRKPVETPPPTQSVKEELQPEQVPLPVRVPVPPPVPPPVPLIPKSKRLIRQRQPFDIYEDQYLSLKKIADREREFVNGRGMSQMVRDAIDNYLRGHPESE